MSPNRRRVLVLGGGVAGIEVATRLGRARRDNSIDVTLVDSGAAHVWKPMLHMFASGTAQPGRQSVGFYAHAAGNGYRFQRGTLVSVDRARREVVVAPLDNRPERVSLPYDALVVAVGSRANDFGTRGVDEHCAKIDDLRDAEAFHALLREQLLLARVQGVQLRCVIVGGGATGVELAAELKQATDRLAKLGGCGSMQLVLIETGSRLLPHFPERVSVAATRTLRGLDVDVRTNTKVVSADERGFDIGSDARIDAELRVWAAGVKAPSVLDTVGLPLSKTGQIVVGPGFRPAEDQVVFAIGDCAHCTDREGKPVPATAQAAREQAIHLARHLDAALTSGRIEEFHYKNKGSIVSLADYNGWGTLAGYQFGGGLLRGLSARAAHALLYRQHQMEVLGVPRGMTAWMAETLDRFTDAAPS